jgi:hypothetical protein
VAFWFRDDIFVGKPKGKRLFGRPEGRWLDVKIHLKGNKCEDVNLIELSQEGRCERKNAPPNSIKDRKFLMRSGNTDGQIWTKEHATKIRQVCVVVKLKDTLRHA